MGELHATLSFHEIHDWSEYAQLEPFGAVRDNMHAAMLATLFFNAHRGDNPPMSTDDFMIRDPEAIEDRKLEGVAAMVRGLAALATPAPVANP